MDKKLTKGKSKEFWCVIYQGDIELARQPLRNVIIKTWKTQERMVIFADPTVFDEIAGDFVDGIGIYVECFDHVVMVPPFGIRNLDSPFEPTTFTIKWDKQGALIIAGQGVLLVEEGNYGS